MQHPLNYEMIAGKGQELYGAEMYYQQIYEFVSGLICCFIVYNGKKRQGNIG